MPFFFSGRVPTAINGLRPAYVNITHEGVNFPDNFIRTNTPDFQPLRLFTDQVAEVAITASNSGAAEFTRANNNLLANLAGLINNASRTFNVTSRGSGFVSGAPDRRRYRDTQFQVNDTCGKVMNDTAGDSQAQFEPFLDINNGRLERARTPCDVTHAFKSNSLVELPFGKGREWDLGWTHWILGGWAASGIMTWQPGNPISIMSYRGTLNRGNRSNTQNGTTATSPLKKSELDRIVGFRMTGVGPYMIAASAINTGGRGTNVDGKEPYSGQAFYHPEAGTVGTLQRRYFSGPAWFNLDFAAQKSFQIDEQHRIELRVTSTNFFNNPMFYVGDMDINSVNFGRIGSLMTSPRRIQFELFYRF